MALGADDNPVSVKICCVLGFQTQHDSWLAERLTWRRERGQTSVGVHKCTTHTGHSKGYAPLVEVTRTLFFGWWSSFGGNLGPLFRLSERRNLCRVWFIDWILKARQHHVVSILVVCVFSLSVWFVFFYHLLIVFSSSFSNFFVLLLSRKDFHSRVAVLFNFMHEHNLLYCFSFSNFYFTFSEFYESFTHKDFAQVRETGQAARGYRVDLSPPPQHGTRHGQRPWQDWLTWRSQVIVAAQTECAARSPGRRFSHNSSEETVIIECY